LAALARQVQAQLELRRAAEERAVLAKRSQRANDELNAAYDATLESMARALDLRDREVEGHLSRVADITVRLAQNMGVPQSQLVQIRRGALLHDIGKMGIPDGILLKPSALSDEEWEVMHLHPVYANEMLSPIELLRPALDIPYCHHERWDGQGYPRGLRHDEIPLAARIFAVVDVWDALKSDRPYRAGWAEPRVRDYISKRAGADFDPRVVEEFLKMTA
jgi:HD-GYP domain-containing protein (c-di-GMP phosphodiesterase class II)